MRGYCLFALACSCAAAVSVVAEEPGRSARVRAALAATGGAVDERDARVAKALAGAPDRDREARLALALAGAPRYDPGVPTGAVKYDRAKFTQSISVLTSGGADRDIIQPVPVLSMPDTRWHQPGGLEGVTGWRSERYRYLPPGEKVKVWVGNVEVENSITNPTTGEKYRQLNRALQRSYPDGTRFDEVLVNAETGVVFEHRVREKKNGQWSSLVYHRDESARPAGYTGLRASCSSCHSEAGTGKYDAGLVPGGDTVLSDPLPWELWLSRSPENDRVTVVEKTAPAKSGCDCGCAAGGGCSCGPNCPAPKAPAPVTRPVYVLPGFSGGCSGGSCGVPASGFRRR